MMYLMWYDAIRLQTLPRRSRWTLRQWITPFLLAGSLCFTLNQDRLSKLLCGYFLVRAIGSLSGRGGPRTQNPFSAYCLQLYTRNLLWIRLFCCWAVNCFDHCSWIWKLLLLSLPPLPPISLAHSSFLCLSTDIESFWRCCSRYGRLTRRWLAEGRGWHLF